MAAAADDIVATMKNVVAFDDGDLKDSIGWTWGRAPKGSIQIAVVGQGDMTITIYAGNEKAFYARFVEFGTAPHKAGGKFKGADHPGTRKQPFFYPSYRAHRKAVRRDVRKAIVNAVKRVAAS